MSNVDKLIATARGEVDYCEKATNSNLDSKTANAGSGNYTKYARDLDNISGFYNGRKNGHAWCDVFVDWCMVKTFGVDNAKKLLCQPSKSLGAGCKYSMQYYQKKGQFYNSPKPGDQIFFIDSDGDGISHTGYVYKVDSTYVYTVEGNTSSKSGVVANGGCVAEKKYKLNYARIAGYGRPDYDSIKLSESSDTKTETSKPASTTTTTQTTTSTKVGSIVYFTGTKHYASSNSTKGKTCKPGKAKITAIYNGKHPYHLKKVSGGGSTVNGWVDAKDISATAKSAYQCIHTVKSGDSLWELASKYLGKGKRYKEIMAMNGKTKITISVGEKLKIPNK